MTNLIKHQGAQTYRSNKALESHSYSLQRPETLCVVNQSLQTQHVYLLIYMRTAPRPKSNIIFQPCSLQQVSVSATSLESPETQTTIQINLKIICGVGLHASWFLNLKRLQCVSSLRVTGSFILPDQHMQNLEEPQFQPILQAKKHMQGKPLMSQSPSFK